MPWQTEQPYLRLCGLCSRPVTQHIIQHTPAGWQALCAHDMLSDITDQQLLQLVAEGNATPTSN